MQVQVASRNKVESTFRSPKSGAKRSIEDGYGAKCLPEHMVCVRQIAVQIRRRLPVHIELDELISAGALGLVDAYQRFDPRRHVQFKSFAQFRIRGAILDSLRAADWGPRVLRTKQRVISCTVDALTQKLRRLPGEQEIAAELGMDLADYQELACEVQALQMESLDADCSSDSACRGLDLLPDANGRDPLAHLLEGETKQILADAVESLPERERLVLKLYFYEELTLREIGFVLGVVESRVSQIRSEALARLRMGFGVQSACNESRVPSAGPLSNAEPGERKAA